jgi:hypothetical protein
MSKEITLAEWAKKRGIPARTATGWAKDLKIPATKRKKSVQITLSRKIETYFIAADATSPE